MIRAVIDLNHVSFYSYMAVRSAYKKQPPPEVLKLREEYKLTHPDSARWTELKGLIKKSSREHILIGWRRMVFELIAMFVEESQAKDLVICGDPRGAKWRHEIYPDYKGNRKDRKLFDDEDEENAYYAEMDRIFWELFPKVAPNVGFFRIPRVEADDIIATMVITFPNDEIVVMSGDGDFVQLYRHRNFRLYNPKQSSRGWVLCDDPKFALDLKVLIGDDSDNIPNVARGYGPGKCGEALRDPTKLAKLLAGKEQTFDLNRRLIDMSLIPSEITSLITERLMAREVRSFDSRSFYNLAVTERLFKMQFTQWKSFSTFLGQIPGGWVW